MNTFRKKAALDRYAEQVRALNNPEEAATFLAEREEKYQPSEIVEIIAASMQGEGEGEGEAKDTEVKEVETKEPEKEIEHAKKETFTKRTGGLIRFEKFKIKEVFDFVVIPGRGKERILKFFQKTGDCLQVTHIEQHHADVLNAQVVNSRHFYFKEGDSDQIDPTPYF